MSGEEPARSFLMEKEKTMTVDGVTLTYEQLVKFYDMAAENKEFRAMYADSKIARSTGYLAKQVEETKKELARLRAKIIIEKARDGFIPSELLEFASEALRMMMGALSESGWSGFTRDRWSECAREIEFAASVAEMGKVFARLGNELSGFAAKKEQKFIDYEAEMKFLDDFEKRHPFMKSETPAKSAPRAPRERDVDYELIEDSLMGGFQPKFKYK